MYGFYFEKVICLFINLLNKNMKINSWIKIVFFKQKRHAKMASSEMITLIAVSITGLVNCQVDKHDRMHQIIGYINWLISNYQHSQDQFDVQYAYCFLVQPAVHLKMQKIV